MIKFKDIIESKMKTFKAVVKDKQTKEIKIITSDYYSKKDFVQDLKSNGYIVNLDKVKEAKEFDRIMKHTNATDLDWNSKKYDKYFK